MSKFKFIILILGIIVLAGCSNMEAEDTTDTIEVTEATEDTQEIETEEQTYEEISMAEAQAIMESDEDYLIVDVRTLLEYNSGHIEGAINVPNETITEMAATDLPDKDRLLLVYCRSGNRSKQASIKLAALGYTNVKEFGGIADWPGETVR